MSSAPVEHAPHVELLPFRHGATLDITVDPSPAAPHPLQADIDARWVHLLRTNPRYHDGEVLSVSSWSGATIHCQRRTFRDLAVRPHVNTGCEMLAVTAVVAARAREGAWRILLGKRHQQTRVYGGQWELGPSGGVPPPAASVTRLPESEVIAQVGNELREESGLSVADAAISLAGIVRDLAAFSLDIVYQVVLSTLWEDLRPGERDWEYPEIRWVTLQEASEWARVQPQDFIPPTKALLERPRWLLPSSILTD